MPHLELEDANLYYELRGEGLPVLFIQGIGVIGAGWEPQIAELSQDFQCLAFDNCGIGESAISGGDGLTVKQMANDARQLLDAAGWESAHVVGHSMGGVIAQQLALDVPHRVRSLSLLCTFSQGGEGARLTPWVLWISLRVRVGSRAMRRRAFLRMLFPQEYLAMHDADDLATKMAPIIGRDLAEQPAILMEQLKALRAHDCSDELHRLSHIPTLVVSADKDPIALPRHGRRLSQLIAESRYLEISGTAHGVTIQEPERINNLLRDHFLASEKSL